MKANAADAVLMGSVGGPEWDGLPFEKRAERGLLRVEHGTERGRDNAETGEIRSGLPISTFAPTRSRGRST